jgi:hypothetical protein
MRAEYSAYTTGSDHDVYQDSSFGIPAIYLNDWPDRYIHTNFDTAANIDPTKLKRAAFIGAASGYFLATNSETKDLVRNIQVGRDLREAEFFIRVHSVPEDEACGILQARILLEQAIKGAREGFFPLRGLDYIPKRYEDVICERVKTSPKSDDATLKLKRKLEPKGPLAVFGYDYFAEHAKAAGLATPKLLSYKGLWGSGEEYPYEVLNFADGKRNAQEIRDAVSAEYGPVPLELVVEYLKALEKIGVVEQVK